MSTASIFRNVARAILPKDYTTALRKSWKQHVQRWEIEARRDEDPTVHQFLLKLYNKLHREQDDIDARKHDLDHVSRRMVLFMDECENIQEMRDCIKEELEMAAVRDLSVEDIEKHLRENLHKIPFYNETPEMRQDYISHVEMLLDQEPKQEYVVEPS